MSTKEVKGNLVELQDNNGGPGGVTLESDNGGNQQTYTLPGLPGSSGQVLTTDGANPVANLTWQTAGSSTFYAASVYFVTDSSNHWSTTSNSITNFTKTGTPTLSTAANIGSITIAAAGSGDPGFDITYPRDGTVRIQCCVYTFTSSGATVTKFTEAIQLNSTNSLFTAFNDTLSNETVALNSAPSSTHVLTTYATVTASSTDTVYLTGSTSGTSTMTIQGVASNGHALFFDVQYVD